MKERSPQEKQRWMLASVLALGACLAAAIWFVASSGRQAEAQQPAQIQVQILPGGGRVQIGGGFRRFSASGQEDGDDSLDGVFLPADRDTTRQWERAKSLLDGGHYTDAITLLDEILQNGEDFFFKPQTVDKSDQPTSDREVKPGAPTRDPKLPIRMNSDAAPLQQGSPKPANNPQPQDAGKAPTAKTNKEAYRSLKSEAQRLIGEMPEAGREAYELQFGARAQQMLNEAAATGDIGELEAVTRRYFHTTAGYQATMLLGRHHLDHDQPLAAAFCFQRLLETPAAASKLDPMLSILLAVSWQRAGMPERAEETLTALKKKDPNAKLRIADKPVRLFADEKQSLAWLESTMGKPAKAAPGAQQQWTLVRGDAARNATSVGGMPLLTPLWRVSTTNHPTLEKTLGLYRQQYLDQGIAAQPAMQPLAVENLVLMRTARDLLAVDFATGKRLWPVRTTSDTSLEQLLSSSPGPSGSIDAQRNPALIERFWEDATFGTLSSDGERVYMIDGLDASMTPADMQQGQIIGRIFVPGARIDGRGIGVKRFNVLTAHELRTQGKLKWEVGGASGGDEPQLAGAFFLGPPLPLEGKLYVLAETKASEIKLCVLDAKTGKLDWSQQLAMVEQGVQNIQQDPLRRLAGCSPSYADGVVLCPTTAGAIVAVDIANRTLRWGYQYQREGAMQSNVMIMRGGGGGWQQWNNGIPQMSPVERWMDASITIAGNYALMTPLESNELHCVNLVDGKLLWKLPRGENLYVGGVHDGTLVLVGKHQVSLVKLGAEKPTTTKAIDLPSGAMPSGRGFLSSDSYFLPLTSAEVAQIDLTTGKIASRSKSRSGAIPGNLICYQGEVISQGIDYVETFFQREPLEERIAATLKEKPNDGWALAHRGELELEDGKLDAAVTDLRQAYSQNADPGNRELLFEALLTGLSQDFKAHRDALPDLQKLVEDDHEKGILLRVTAAGLQQAGDVDGAMQALLKLAGLELPAQELEDLEPKLSVLRARWVRSQFQNMWSSAKGDDRKKIDAALEKDLEQAIAAQNTKSLRQFVTCFGDHPVADRARMALATELTGPETLLEREQLLLELESSPEPSTRAAAALKLASVLQDAGQTGAALAIYRKLEADFGDKPVQNGKNAKELLAAMPESSMLRRAAEQDRHWPKGEVKIEQADNNSHAGNAASLSRVFGTELEGKRSPFFTGVLLGRDLGRQEIVGVDGLGKQLFQIPLGGDATRSLGLRGVNVFGNNVATGDFAMVQGHILIVCTGYQLMALDTLKPVAVAGNSLLWMKDLGDISPMIGNVQPLPRQNMPWGGMRRIQGPQTIFGDVALCGDRTLCFQHGRDITAIDPLTGQTQWVRHGVELGCDLFGDDEMVIAAPPNGRPALVLRASDGQLMGERTVPPMEKRWTNYGHRMLVFHDQTNASLATLALFDPWTQDDDWSETFTGWNNGQNPTLKGALVNGEMAAVMQTDGKFVLLNLADGHKIIDTELKEEKDEHGLLQNIQVIASPDQYLLLTNRQPQPGVVTPPMHGMGDVRNAISNSQGVITMNAEPISQIMSGHVYAFERSTGKPQWSGPAAIDQHGYLPGQPSELPVLPFVRNVNAFSATRNAQSTRGSVLCLDKRTGRAVYSDDDIQPLNGFEITGNPEEKTVTLAFAGQPNQPATPPVTLKFTDTPVADAAPYQAGEADKPDSAKETKEKDKE